MGLFRLSILAALLMSFHGISQQKTQGPVIEGFGDTFKIPNTTYKTNTENIFSVVFDVMNSPEDKSAVNPWMETAARFLNMHAGEGVPLSGLKVALVVHHKASTDLLKDPFYKERFGVPNPNTMLLKELMEAGAHVIFCGQSSMAREVPIDKTIGGVRLSLSAMTALIQLQDEGYRLIKF